MRARAGFLGGILVLLIGAEVAWLAYQTGLSQAATTAVATGTSTAGRGLPSQYIRRSISW